MSFFKPQARITMGLVGIMTSLIMLTFVVDIMPDRNGAVLEGRAALAESIAIYSTALVNTAKVIAANQLRLETDFNLLVERNDELLSLALRKQQGQVLISTGDHETRWVNMQGKYSKDAQVSVPIWAGKQQWGQLEMRFKPLVDQSGWGVLRNPMLQMVLFTSLLGFVVFYFYLGKVLRQLDPSQAIPGRVRSALDTMAEGLLILDRKEHIVLANLAFSSLVDKSADKLLGFRAGDLPWVDTDGNRLAKEARPWLIALVQGKIKRDITLRLEIAEGEIRTLKTNCSPVLGDGGKYAGVLVSFADITELEEKEVELIKSKKMAEDANNAKSSFLANMSHEIRTPMNAILGFTEILKRGYVKNEQESLRYLNTIHSSGKSLLELINDILDLSKVESGRIEYEKIKVEPYTIIHEVIQMLKVKADEKGISLKFKASTDLPTQIETDPVRFRQIAFNLIGNSIKFTDTGSVSVICRFEKKAGVDQLLIDIIDTGIGMTEEALEKIFDPFVQADNSVTRRFGGTGLGLTISRRFAQAMGGDIHVRSRPGQGSTFTIVLSTGDLSGVSFLKPAEVALLQQKCLVEEGVRWQFPEARVLVVDDGSENRELVRLLLEDAGLFVDEAENGQQGVDKALVGSYNVILMDVNMPVMDGFTAVAILRKKGITIPVIALTANAMKGYESDCLEAGYSGYLSKPINIDRFMELMAQLLGGSKVEGDMTVAEQELRAVDSLPEIGQDMVSSPIISRLPADNPKFHSIIVRFVRRLDEQLENLQKAVKGNDFIEVASLAHWLKGAGGTVGFDVFTEPAADLEIQAKAGNRKQTGELVALICTLAERIQVAGDDITAFTPEATSDGPAGSQPAGPADDSGTQKTVVSRLAGNQRLQRIILNFIDKLHPQVEKMEAALKSADSTELAALAHWLKGSGGTVGYDDFTEPAAELEQFAKAGQLDSAALALEKIQLLVEAIVPPGEDGAK